jgi:mannitol-specific phosphotransferase system IIBC component
MNIEEWFGWTGAILVLIAYYMVSTGKAQATSVGFQLINIIGAGFLIYYTYTFKAYASMIVNIIWVLIGMLSFKKVINLQLITNKLIKFNPRKLQMNLKTKLFCAFVSLLFVFTFSSKTLAQTQEESDSAQKQDTSTMEENEILNDVQLTLEENEIEESLEYSEDNDVITE